MLMALQLHFCSLPGSRFSHDAAHMLINPYHEKTSLFSFRPDKTQPMRHSYGSYMSLVMRKPAFCICENKDADQLPEADQRLCFRYIDSTIPLLPLYEISSL